MKSKSNIFIGSITIAPGLGICRYLEKSVWNPEYNIETELQKYLAELFYFPEAPTKENVQLNDFGLDIHISDFSTGEGFFVEYFPLIWKPKVELHAKLYNLSSGETLETIIVTEEASLREYLARALEWKALFNISETFTTDDMKVLVGRGSVRLLRKIYASAA